jgi:hypothetical protein
MADKCLKESIFMLWKMTRLILRVILHNISYGPVIHPLLVLNKALRVAAIAQTNVKTFTAVI